MNELIKMHFAGFFLMMMKEFTKAAILPGE